MEKRYLLIFLLGLLLISIVSAVPPIQQTQIIDTGIIIETPIIETHTYNQSFIFQVHAYNASNGMLLTNDTTYCVLHLYDTYDGTHLVESNMSFDSNGIDFEYNISAGNFTKIGQYTALIYCSGDGIGGFFEYSFDVTTTGNPTPEGMPMFQMGVLLIIFATACFLLYLSRIMEEQGFRIFFLLTSLVFLMAAMLSAYMISADGNVIAATNTTTLALVFVLGIILFIIFIYILIKQTVKALDMFRITKGLKMSPEYNVGIGSKVIGMDTRKGY